MKIAVHQMCSGTNVSDNVADIVAAIKAVAAQGAAMYFAPEMSVLIDRDRQRSAQLITTEHTNGALRDICKAAASAAIWVHLGSMPVRRAADHTRLANRTFIIDNLGQIRARYDKMHLFDVVLADGEHWRESSVYDAGDRPVIVDTPLGPIGLTICFDVRFPDLFSALASAGAEIIAVPAAFTVATGRAHWHTLLRARAIETQAFVIAAAQSGEHQDGRQTFGHSLVVDPWGQVLLDMGEGESLGFAELDLARIAEVRSQIPIADNRRATLSKVARY